MSEPEPGVVRVKIYDREYALRTSGDSERLRSICLSLDQLMREIATSTGAVDTLKVAILAAISVSDDLYGAREEMHKLDESISRRSVACVSMLERFLA